MKKYTNRYGLQTQVNRFLQSMHQKMVYWRKINLHQRSRRRQPIGIKLLVVLAMTLFFSVIVQNQQAQAVQLNYRLSANIDGVREGRLATELKEKLENLSEGEMVSVIIMLEDQANLTLITDHKRDVRISKVIHALQNKSEATQKQLKAYLSSKQSTGEVETFESYWIFNGLAVTASPSVINEISTRPEVKSISPDSILVAPASAPSQVSGSPLEPNINLINSQSLWDM